MRAVGPNNGLWLRRKRGFFSFSLSSNAAPLSSLWGGLQLGMLAWSWRFAVQCLFLSGTRWTWLGVFNVIACVFNMEADCPGFRNGSHICKATKVAENRCKEDRFVACFLLCMLRAVWRQLAEESWWLLQDLQVPLVLSLLGGPTFQPPFCDPLAMSNPELCPCLCFQPPALASSSILPCL